jgi:hypothetical protein
MQCTSCQTGTLNPSVIEGLFRANTCSGCGGDWVLIEDYAIWRERHPAYEFAKDIHFEEILELLRSNEVKIDASAHKSGMDLTEANILDLCKLLISESRENDLDTFLSLLKEHCMGDKTNFSTVLLEIGVGALSSGDNPCAVYLLTTAVLLAREYSTAEAVFNCNKYLYYLDVDNEGARENYFKGFQNYIETSDQIDVLLFDNRIGKFLQEREFEKAVKYSNLIIDLDGLGTQAACEKLLSILYLKLNALKDKEERIALAVRIKEIISNTNVDDLKLSIINEDTLKVIRERTEALLISIKPIEQVINLDRKYGRNEKVKVRYEDGREEQKKYKQVKEGLEAGFCIIVA